MNPSPARLKVHAWPDEQDQLSSLSLPSLAAGAAVVVLGIATPRTPVRRQARALCRSALQEMLAMLLACRPEAIQFDSQPGQALRLLTPEVATPVGLSLSHEPGLSLAAIHAGGAVGVDVMRVEPRPLPEWLPDWQQVAQDYLGRAAWQRIARQASWHQAEAFALEWTRVEACLKCHGRGLSEWRAESDATLARCDTWQLDLPQGWIGTVATLPSK